MSATRTPVNWLRAFEVAARRLSFSAAAHELHVTPSAVSQQVRLLENRLGKELFQRHARGLRLTVAGEALVPVCRESFARLEGTLQELFGDRSSERLVVRVAAGFARSWLLRQLAAFSRAHPDVPIRLVASIWAGEPLDPDVDLDIRMGSAPVVGMQSHRLTQDELFPVCAPGLLPRASRAGRTLDLDCHPLLHTIGFAQGWSHWLAAAGISRPPRAADIEFDSMLLSLEMAALGEGVALARSSFAADLLQAGRLVTPFQRRLAASDNLYLVHESGLRGASPAALFRDWLLRVAPAKACRRKTTKSPP